MNAILIFKTASDSVMERLFAELKKEQKEVYCLVQSSALEGYQKKYPKCNFVDILQEGFYDLSESVIDIAKALDIETIYVPTTGLRANNFSNILEIINKLEYKQILFYNCDGDKSIINKMGKMQEWLAKQYIKIVKRLYTRG